ncbi:MAG: hypothetical protein GC160_07925 [Acidobacteria bacterium]|nr:hypothetical protein [Acidobacteriota bacterium]
MRRLLPQALLGGAALLSAACAWRLAGPGVADGGAIHWGAIHWDGVAALVAGRLVCSGLFRLERMRWRNWNQDDRLIWTAAALCGSVVGFLTAGALGLLLPLNVAIVEGLLFLQLGSLVGERWPRRGDGGGERKAPALIYGAGGQGRLLLAELRRPDSGFDPIGWIDDDPAKADAVLGGEPVLGPIEALPFLTELHGVRTVFTAIPGLPADRLERAAEMARMGGARLIVLPTVRDAVRALRRRQLAA